MRTKTVTELAWFEYKVARQMATGNGDAYAAQWHIPGWFVFDELGFGHGQAPSIVYTLLNLAKINRRHRAAVNVVEARAVVRTKQVAVKRRHVGRRNVGQKCSRAAN